MTGTAVVRVLTGTRAGAEAPLPPSGRASIGHEYWHDIVVREDSTRGCAVELETGEDGVARLTILGGDALLLGSTLRPGDTAVLPPYVPVAIGGIAFAFGAAASDRWSEATAIALTAQQPADPAAAPEAAAPLTAGWRESWRDGTNARLGRAFRPAAVLGIVAAIVVAFAAGPAIDALQLGGGPADRTARALEAAGFRNVAVQRSDDGTAVIAGYVPTDSDRQRVQQLVDAQALRATLSIETGEELARSAADVARMSGFKARARTIAAGNVELTTAPIDIAGRSRIETLLRRDVPGLRRLTFREDLGLAEPEDVRTVADVTKRVSSVIDGDPAYILTVDGARYFPGAVTPSGHQLVAIEERTVVLERNGRRIRIRF